MGAVKGNYGQLAHILAFHYPLTFTGSLLFLVNSWVFVNAVVGKDSYSLLLSSVFLLALFCLIAAGKYQAFKSSRARMFWGSENSTDAASPCSMQEFTFSDVTVWPFFRRHCLMKGRTEPGKAASIRLSQDCASKGKDSIQALLCVPFSGVVDATAWPMIKDVFGMTRSRFGEPQRRKIMIRPVFLPDCEKIPIHAMDGLSERNKKKESDVERYLMREYLPGDKFRDINWKASSRFSELFTRISPMTQEETHIICVILRPYSQQDRETLVSMAHLDYLKSRVLSFVSNVMQSHPGYGFRIVIGRDEIIVGDGEDLEKLGDHLCSVRFQKAPPLSEDPVALASGPVFVFSTPFDTTLHAALAAGQCPETRLYATAFPDGSMQQELKKLTPFRLTPTLMVPGMWVFRRDPDSSKGHRKEVRDSQVRRDVLRVGWFDFNSLEADDD